MKALTLWQPWAGAMALGVKEVETRGWRLDYRGPLCIHASMRKMTEEDWLCIPYSRRKNADPDVLRMLGLRGGILAVVDVYGCLRTEAINNTIVGGTITDDERQLGDYSPGRFGILTRNLRRLRHPVPCKGSQGLWTVPADVEQLVRVQLTERTRTR